MVGKISMLCKKKKKRNLSGKGLDEFNSTRIYFKLLDVSGIKEVMNLDYSILGFRLAF